MPPPGKRMKSSLAPCLLAVGAAAGLVVLFAFDPAQSGFYPACPLHSIAGLDCPACGSLRAAHLFLRGHFRDAFALNPYLFFALPLAALACFRPAAFRSRPAVWALSAALVAVFVLRNASRFLRR